MAGLDESMLMSKGELFTSDPSPHEKFEFTFGKAPPRAHTAVQTMGAFLQAAPPACESVEVQTAVTSADTLAEIRRHRVRRTEITENLADEIAYLEGSHYFTYSDYLTLSSCVDALRASNKSTGPLLRRMGWVD